MFVVKSSVMKAAEQNADSNGISYFRLMENAGSAVAHEIKKGFDVQNKNIAIVCGKGNNGGDGFVVARKLAENGAKVFAVLTCEPQTEIARKMHLRLIENDITVLRLTVSEDWPHIKNCILNSDIIVDAILGTGFKGSLTDEADTLIKLMNRSDAKKIAIDVPTGVYCDTAAVYSVCFKADLTVTFGAYKPCHVELPAAEFCGRIKVADIGIDNTCYDKELIEAEIISAQFVKSLLTPPSDFANKFNCGSVGMIVGSYGMAGAAVLASKAAYKSGAGLVRAVVSEAIYNVVASSVPEAVFSIYKPEADAKAIADAVQKSDAVLIGCGLGKSEFTLNILKELLSKNIRLVIDADGINSVADNIELLRESAADIIITPHEGEAARLLHCTADEIKRDRFGAVNELQRLTGGTVVLKGRNTIIKSRNYCYMCDKGNSGMATAGSGDTLAGICATFFAQGLSAVNAAASAVYIHALAGDTAASRLTKRSVTASGIINSLPQAFSLIDN